MGPKIFTLLALACLVHVAVSFEANINPETREELRKAIVELGEAKSKSGNEIDAVRRPIEKKIDSALNPIEKKLKALKEEVKKAEKQAEADKKDIKECVDAERRSAKRFDKRPVRKCREVKEIREAGMKLGELGLLIRSLRSAEHRCFIKGAEADACVKQLIEKSRKRVPELQKEISEKVKLVKPENQNKCIEDGAAQVQKEADAIETAWRECIKRRQ